LILICCSKFEKIMERFSMDGSPSDCPNLFTDVGSPPTMGIEDSISLHVSIITSLVIKIG